MYGYKSELYCDDCGEKIEDRIDAERSAAGLEPFDADTDSDDYPKWADDNAESDSPSQCAECEELLGTLTAAGVAYVLEKLREDQRSDVVLEWMTHYGIDWPKDLYTVVFENSDGDPMLIGVTVRGPYADEWCDAHGSLAGSTWECPDGEDWCYDSFFWYPGLIEEIKAEGFDCDFGQYSEPEPYEVSTAEFACVYFDGDYSAAAEWIAKTFPPVKWRVRCECYAASGSVQVNTEIVVEADNEEQAGYWAASELRRDWYYVYAVKVERVES